MHFDSFSFGNGVYIFTISLFVIVFLLATISMTMRWKKEKMIKKTKTEHNFEYLDFFYYTIHDINPQESGGRIYIYGYLIIRDINTSQIYAINYKRSNISMVSSSYKKIDIYRKGKDSKNVLLNFYDKGSFWIGDELGKGLDFNKDDKIILDRTQLKYCGNLEKTEGINSKELYNLNSKYDLDLFNKAIFFDGIAEFYNE